ncbi:aminodeoxychorismate lyase [Ectothiorhodospira haloalkaliphila]|uniref:aminodeoxychorismate lyase n=1 Tax=Ectothiorhodospira haloalkaliphila TaxID=421628 RepID=UPI001EE864BB|nr:aminodeoxychorismate lyase [Ectothiorhodospira haloalkaliphila]MCG5526278.1 aminodeoxychorismate lyase [Ectothiorhodospira haloalkaliphila]
MSTDRVTFSFFRYPLGYSPAAFLFMGFRRLFIGPDVPAGDIRLMGCGGGDGFSILPDPRTYCLLSGLPDPADDQRLRQSRFYRRIAGPSEAQLHIELRPISGHGTWAGREPFEYSGERATDGPVAVLTHARVRRNRVRSFWSAVPAIRRHLHQVPGCWFHIGFGETPLRTLATFTLWQDTEQMRAFAYHKSPHHRTLRAARQQDWLSESIFVRFRVVNVTGDLSAWSPHLAAGAAA